MCGITGFVDFNKKITSEQLSAACNTLIHRGPDDSDCYIHDTGKATVGLGHRRLSILDLSPLGHQPMFSDDRQVVVILNGEIYNFREIRKNLEELGHHFRSNSDTEVVIHAYQQYGMDFLQQLIGMFAIALLDLGRQQCYLIRDRAGVKPLYYSFVADRLIFGSELKAFHQYPGFDKAINDAGVAQFFQYGYIRAPHTIFKDALKLEPGHYARLDLQTKSFSLHQYWNVLDHYRKPILEISEQEAIEELDKLFVSAFQYRMVSDVPVGVFLSGGYDSSLVAAVLQRHSDQQLKTYTIGFHENEFNEAGYARSVAGYLGTDHHEYFCTTKEAQEIIPGLPFYYDEPFGDFSAIPTILVSRFARKEVTVALSADAGDEIFAGYNRYDQLTRLKQFRQYTPGFARKLAAGVLQAASGSNATYKKIASVMKADDDVLMSDRLSRHFTERELAMLLPGNKGLQSLLLCAADIPEGADFINSMLAADYRSYMVDDILTKVDRATMSVSLEGREPLLDHRIVEFSAQLPSSMKYKKGNKKYLLKKITHRYIPQNLMDRPKMGFGVPVHDWMRAGLKDLLVENVNVKSVEQHGLVNSEYAQQVVDRFLAGRDGYGNKAWLLLMFQMWWKEWMD